LYRVFTQQPLEPGRELLLEKGAAHHLARVLRVAAGQKVVLFNGDGQDYSAEVRRIDRTHVVLGITGRMPGLAEPPIEIIVVQALSRGERMELTLQKCTELGAAAFQPVVGERSGLRLKGDKLTRRVKHWQKIVISACEQCGRSRIPRVMEPLGLEEWLAQPAGASRLALVPDAPAPLAAVQLRSVVELAVGPEGGFSPRETALMERSGVQAVGLGPRTLRTETAAPAAVAILQCLRGDLGP